MSVVDGLCRSVGAVADPRRDPVASAEEGYLSEAQPSLGAQDPTARLWSGGSGPKEGEMVVIEEDWM